VVAVAQTLGPDTNAKKAKYKADLLAAIAEYYGRFKVRGTTAEKN